MKKLFLSMLAMTTCLVVMATPTSIAKITVTGTTGGYGEITLVEDAARTSAYEDGYDARVNESFANDNSLLFYGMVGTDKCDAVFSNNLSGTELVLVTNKVDDEYTLSFNNLMGADLTLYDRVAKVSKVINSSTPNYTFTVTSAQMDRKEVTGRFIINYVAPTYVYMNGDFDNPGGSWESWPGSFTPNGTVYSQELTLAANEWYHFKLMEQFGDVTYTAADGSSFDRDNNSHNLYVNDFTSALLLHTDVAGTYTFTWNDLTDNLTITFPAAPSYAAEVTTNASGLATFSFNQDLVAADGAKLYKGDLDGETLVLTQVDYVKAGEGVIVYNEAGTATTYHFNAGTGTSDFSGNELLAASTWNVAENDGYNIYVLSGSSLYLYEGTAMKPNKAYLKVNQNPYAGAPKRISFRFNQPTDVENTKAAEVKAEKFVEDGQIFIRRGNEVFNLQGQKVNF